MKKVLGIISGLILGGLLAFFGVLVSVFSDGSINERLVTIAVVLVIYGIIGAVFGYIVPQISWKWGLILGLPGVIILLLYSFKETNLFLYSIVYMVLIMIFPGLGSYSAARIKRRKPI